ISAFLALTQQYPEVPEPYNNLAALYAKRGQYDNARATLETAISSNPGFALGYQNLGSLYLKLAEDAYTHASTLDKRDADSRGRVTKIQAILSPASAAEAAKAAESASAASATPALPELTPPEVLPSSPNTGGLPLSPQRN
ncbi:MAG TPA: tetratricopeptide repeat protein, partial [Pararobbsia sp.]|nr:tetratricopeptide repeat protein [Pararobbsia sp.]